MVHVPKPSRLTVLLVTLQMLVVSDVKVTVSPEDAVAVRVNGEALINRSGNGLNAMVCASSDPEVTLKLRATGAAGA